MATPASSILPYIKIDYKRIELFRRAKNTPGVKITPELLKKLRDVDSVDELLNVPSTSTATELPEPSSITDSLPASAVRKNPKRKMDEDLKLTSQEPEDKCAHCDCKMIRVVDPKRGDEQVILECMRSNCLATVKFTTLPVGTVKGKEPNAIPRSFYNALDRYYLPNTDDPESDSEDTQQRAMRNKKIQKHQNQLIFESSPRGIYIDVPGQEMKARFMN